MKFLSSLLFLLTLPMSVFGAFNNKDSNTLYMEGFTVVELLRLKQELSEEKFQEFLLEQHQLQHPNSECNRKLQAVDLNPCFYQGDGCTTCWFDTTAGNAEVNCPNFCGPGHSYAASVLTESYYLGGIHYPYTTTACSVWGCASIADSYCFEFSLYPQEDKWTCSDICGSDAAVTPTAGTNPTTTTTSGGGGGGGSITTTNTAVNDNGNGNGNGSGNGNGMGVYSAACDAQYTDMNACGQNWSEAEKQTCLECYDTVVTSAITCSGIESTCKSLPGQCECGNCDASILAWMECEGQSICPGLTCSAGSSSSSSGNGNGNGDEDDDDKAALIGGIVGGILGFGVLVCMVMAVIFILMRGGQHSNSNSNSNSNRNNNNNAEVNSKKPEVALVKETVDNTESNSSSGADPRMLVPTVQGSAVTSVISSNKEYQGNANVNDNANNKVRLFSNDEC